MTVERFTEAPLPMGGYTLGNVSTATEGIYQLPRSDEEERVIYSPETLVEAPGYFPQLDEEKRPKGIEYFATSVYMWAGPASVEFAWGVLPEGMEQPPDEEPPDWASASGTAVRVQPPEMSIYWWRFPGLWDGGVHVSAEIHDGWSPPLGGTFRAENRGQAIALRVDPDIVPAGKVTVFIDGWFATETEEFPAAEVVFEKPGENGEEPVKVTPTRTKIVYRDFTKRHVYQSILCEVDFSGVADPAGLWDVLVKCGRVQGTESAWVMTKALKVFCADITDLGWPQPTWTPHDDVCYINTSLAGVLSVKIPGNGIDGKIDLRVEPADAVVNPESVPLKPGEYPFELTGVNPSGEYWGTKVVAKFGDVTCDKKDFTVAEVGTLTVRDARNPENEVVADAWDGPTQTLYICQREADPELSEAQLEVGVTFHPEGTGRWFRWMIEPAAGFEPTEGSCDTEPPWEAYWNEEDAAGNREYDVWAGFDANHDDDLDDEDDLSGLLKVKLVVARVNWYGVNTTDEGPVSFRPYGKGSIVQAGNPDANDPGIVFWGFATLSPSVDIELPGELQWVQNVRSTREVTFVDGSILRKTTGEQFVRDISDPYPAPGSGKTDDKFYIYTNDSPGQATGGSDPFIERLTVAEEYEMYLLFKPTNRERYTLGVASWSWSATVERDADGNLQLTGGSVPDAPIGVASSQAPVTDIIISQYSFVVVKDVAEETHADFFEPYFNTGQ